LTESLVNETRPFGIKVVLIEPGSIRTNFLGNVKAPRTAADASSSYASMFQTFLKGAASHNHGTSPEEEEQKSKVYILQKHILCAIIGFLLP
jgi:short-subunit dehydrogenase